ncbi:MAG: hypothetical protein ALECFALPRED_000256 [Alectoria fallacina]|uniref:Uncharacterized protein n=1 Tax=Alectoria fallacina TaxID=1903189 RepID=A0A8H3PL29_9LECA|nr:MAG: hypothetical protein ALECFALPRED_000256 [Alectoria fallacina]
MKIIAENTAEKENISSNSSKVIVSSNTVNTSLFPITSSQNFMQVCREYASFASDLAVQPIVPNASWFVSLLTYIRFAEDMKVTGQG